MQSYLHEHLKAKLYKTKVQLVPLSAKESPIDLKSVTFENVGKVHDHGLALFKAGKYQEALDILNAAAEKALENSLRVSTRWAIVVCALLVNNGATTAITKLNDVLDVLPPQEAIRHRISLAYHALTLIEEQSEFLYEFLTSPKIMTAFSLSEKQMLKYVVALGLKNGRTDMMVKYVRNELEYDDALLKGYKLVMVEYDLDGAKTMKKQVEEFLKKDDVLSKIAVGVMNGYRKCIARIAIQTRKNVDEKDKKEFGLERQVRDDVLETLAEMLDVKSG